MKKQRVIVAMSGGVDSSVAAALLKKQGYDVVGIFMKLWSPFAKAMGDKSDNADLVRENICCSVEAITAARAVAGKIGVPFYIVNFADEFKKIVVDYYIKEHENGRTPNPCVICNRDIKGEILMRKTFELNADYLATGHYARIISQDVKIQMPNVKTEYHLLKSKDEKKDQTYFLWTLSQKKLSKLLFPIGHLTKPEVRNIAAKMELPTAERRESQGICFIPDRNISGFLSRYGEKLTSPGPILDKSGRNLGKHFGLINYTIGQRERLGIGGPKAYYVLKLNSKENILIVGDERDLYKSELIATNLSWIKPNLKFEIENLKLNATIRYGHQAENCQIENIAGDKIKVTFDRPQRAITPGQSIVFYSGDEVLGGGIIKSQKSKEG